MIASLILFVMDFFSVIENFDEAGNIIYQPPPLHEVWLDEAEHRHRNKDRICQRHRNEDLLRDCNCAVRKSIPKPVAADLNDAGDVSGVAPISDNRSVDSRSSVVPQNLREIFGVTTTMMMMPIMLMREQIWSHPISMEMREYSRLPTLFKLLRKLLVELVGKQKIIHQLCGAKVLMANRSGYH
jgi:hypothetical protein